MNRFKHHCVASALIILSAIPAHGATPSGARVALIIGNSAYRAAPLENPSNDAHDVAQLLRQAGFSVELRLDTTKVQLIEALQDFGETLKNKKTKFGVFYYAGHGAQQSWRNFLIPVDANVQSGDDVAQMAVDLSELTNEMARTRDRNFLMILDACRDDPFGVAYRPGTKGLSQYDAPAGSLLAYATGPGRVASDGAGRNGLYTTHLLQELAVKGARIEDAFKRVRLGVRLASRGRQIPWESTSLEEDLYIFPQPRRATLSNAGQEELLDQEIAAWCVAKSLNNVDAFASFLREFPSGNASELALARLNTLLRSQAPRPRLAQLHTPEFPDAATQEKTVLAAAALPIMRTMEEAPAGPTAVVVPPTAPVAAQVIVPTAIPTATTAHVVVAAPATSAPLIQADTSPPIAQAPIHVSAAPLATQVAISTPIATDALQDLSVPATPMFQGSYEYMRRYQVGDLFRYQIVNRFNGIAAPHELRVTSVDPQKDEVQYNGGDYVSDSMGNVVKNQRGAMDSPRQFYPAELFVGKKWTTMFRQSRERGGYNTFQYKLKVVAKEMVTVPAGRFEAYKIEARGFNMQRGAALERDIWIAPGIDADIIHETKVRLANGMIEQYDRQELVAAPVR